MEGWRGGGAREGGGGGRLEREVGGWVVGWGWGQEGREAQEKEGKQRGSNNHEGKPHGEALWVVRVAQLLGTTEYTEPQRESVRAVLQGQAHGTFTLHITITTPLPPQDKRPAELPTFSGYANLYRDVRAAVDLCHRDGSLKREVAAHPEQYIHADPHLVPMLNMYKAAGKKLFLATNSLWDYTHVVMNFLLQ